MLARLRPEWALTRDGDRWSVCRIWEDYEGSTIQGIGFGATITEALEGAEAWTAQQEQEASERQASRGLPPYLPSIWADELLRAVKLPTFNG